MRSATFSRTSSSWKMPSRAVPFAFFSAIIDTTASLDARNREVVVSMIAEKKAKGTALLGIFHDEDVREQVADRIVDVSAVSPRKAAA